jgi:hypothetical protein
MLILYWFLGAEESIHNANELDWVGGKYLMFVALQVGALRYRNLLGIELLGLARLARSRTRKVKLIYWLVNFPVLYSLDGVAARVVMHSLPRDNLKAFLRWRLTIFVVLRERVRASGERFNLHYLNILFLRTILVADLQNCWKLQFNCNVCFSTHEPADCEASRTSTFG